MQQPPSSDSLESPPVPSLSIAPPVVSTHVSPLQGLDNNKVEELLRLFRDYPQIREAALQQAGPRGRQPYYKREYAEQIRRFVDEMIEEEKKGVYLDRRFLYTSFPHLEKETLRQTIEQSVRYLVDNMDPSADKIYGVWRSRVEIQKGKASVRVVWKKNIQQDITKLIAEVENKVELKSNTWQGKVDEYLETAQIGQAFKLQANLSEEEVMNLRASIEQLNTAPGLPFAHNIDAGCIKIVRIPQ